MSADHDCIFCKIVAGHIPCQKVFESADVLAFLDINPLAEGHTLVIPKSHAARLDEMSADSVASVFSAVPSIARAVVKVTGAMGYNVLQNNGRASGQEVMHVHCHIIPRTDGDGLGFRWNAGSYDAGRAEQLCSDVASAVESSRLG